MIIRVKHDKDLTYTKISNSMLKDSDLDLQAKGLLCFLLSKPDDWNIRPPQLAKELKESPRTIYRVIRRLISSGYIQRELISRQGEKGRWESHSEYWVFEGKDNKQQGILKNGTPPDKYPQETELPDYVELNEVAEKGWAESG